MLGDHHEMERSRGDGQLAPGTEVWLAGGVWLHRGDDERVLHDGQPEKSAHATTATVASTATATIATSTALLVPGRNGLNPISVPR